MQQEGCALWRGGVGEIVAEPKFGERPAKRRQDRAKKGRARCKRKVLDLRQCYVAQGRV